MQFYTPKIILQPFIENSILHGFQTKKQAPGKSFYPQKASTVRLYLKYQTMIPANKLKDILNSPTKGMQSKISIPGSSCILEILLESALTAMQAKEQK